jgi:hypothetical protein
MPECACGCGGETKKAKFLAGHELKLRKQLEQKLRKQLDETVGSLELLACLVKVTEMYAQDRMSLEGLGSLVRQIYQKD